MNGKGDRPRPMDISRQQWEANWEACFGKRGEADRKMDDRKIGGREPRKARSTRKKANQ